MKLSATTTTDPTRPNPANDLASLRTKSKQEFNRLLDEITEGEEILENSADALLPPEAVTNTDANAMLPLEVLEPPETTITTVIEQFTPTDTDDLSLPEDESHEDLLALENGLTLAANQLLDSSNPAKSNALPDEVTAMESISGNVVFQPMTSENEVTFSLDSGLFAGVQVHISHDQTTGEMAVRFITAAGTLPGISQNLHRIARSLRRNGLRVKELRIEQRTSDASEDESTPDIKQLFRSQN